MSAMDYPTRTIGVDLASGPDQLALRISRALLLAGPQRGVHETVRYDAIYVSRGLGDEMVYLGCTLAEARALMAHMRQHPLHVDASAIPLCEGLPALAQHVWPVIVVLRDGEWSVTHRNRTLPEVAQIERERTAMLARVGDPT